MINVGDVNSKKERMLALLKVRGPSLPIQLARDIGTEMLFANAFLSELFNDKKLKMSNMKVGSSSLYYLSGQENLLENFINYLNIREREAFLVLKKEGVLEDAKLEPVVRVALRAIKDFAVAINVNVDGEPELFWRYYLLSEDDFRARTQEVVYGKKIEKKVENKKEEKAEGKIEEKLEKAVEDEIRKDVVGEVKIENPVKNVRAKRKAGQADTKFADFVKEYLAAKEVEVLQDLLIKKKDYSARVRLDTLFGKQEYYLVAKDKKKIGEEDLLVALQKAQALKMPALVIAKGGLDKEAEESIKEWKNLVKFEKIK